MSNSVDRQYLDLCQQILDSGIKKDDRTGTGTLSIFAPQLRFNLQEGFPLLTTKRLPFRIIFEELRWFLSGSTDLKDLLDADVNIWNADAYRDYLDVHEVEYEGFVEPLSFEEFIESARVDGYCLGRIYGSQWRSWESRGVFASSPVIVDQIAEVIESIRTNPDSRRHIVSAWNVGELDDMALPPCHVLFQFYVANGELSCQLYQRSADVFLGLPFNIASYALLTQMIADICDLEVGELIISIGDAHLYLDHIDAVKEQLERIPKFILPRLGIKRKVDDPAEYEFEDMELFDYYPHPTIKAPLSVGLNEG